ncbi:hypothetical protein ATANTOWER_025575 [Ataeniobius toweri]|uniref:Uncharacterized protein n=1 Tax=Ataeniobius toweri TaxID=208326 RepID=A0ABU7BE91_9TELE|nr:hypothetical protein [Ataeniobius toweri]
MVWWIRGSGKKSLLTSSQSWRLPAISSLLHGELGEVTRGNFPPNQLAFISKRACQCAQRSGFVLRAQSAALVLPKRAHRDAAIITKSVGGKRTASLWEVLSLTPSSA